MVFLRAVEGVASRDIILGVASLAKIKMCLGAVLEGKSQLFRGFLGKSAGIAFESFLTGP